MGKDLTVADEVLLDIGNDTKEAKALQNAIVGDTMRKFLESKEDGSNLTLLEEIVLGSLQEMKNNPSPKNLKILAEINGELIKKNQSVKTTINLTDSMLEKGAMKK